MYFFRWFDNSPTSIPSSEQVKFCVNYFITSRFTDNKTSDVDDGFQHLDKKSELDRKPKREWFFRLVQNSLKNNFYFITSMPYQYAYGSIWSYCQIVPGMTTAWNQTKLSMLTRNRNGGSDFFRLVLSTKQP